MNSFLGAVMVSTDKNTLDSSVYPAGIQSFHTRILELLHSLEVKGVKSVQTDIPRSTAVDHKALQLSGLSEGPQLLNRFIIRRKLRLLPDDFQIDGSIFNSLKYPSLREKRAVTSLALNTSRDGSVHPPYESVDPVMYPCKDKTSETGRGSQTRVKTFNAPPAPFPYSSGSGGRLYSRDDQVKELPVYQDVYSPGYRHSSFINQISWLPNEALSSYGNGLKNSALEDVSNIHGMATTPSGPPSMLLKRSLSESALLSVNCLPAIDRWQYLEKLKRLQVLLPRTTCNVADKGLPIADTPKNDPEYSKQGNKLHTKHQADSAFASTPRRVEAESSVSAIEANERLFYDLKEPSVFATPLQLGETPKGSVTACLPQTQPLQPPLFVDAETHPHSPSQIQDRNEEGPRVTLPLSSTKNDDESLIHFFSSPWRAHGKEISEIPNEKYQHTESEVLNICSNSPYKNNESEGQICCDDGSVEILREQLLFVTQTNEILKKKVLNLEALNRRLEVIVGYISPIVPGKVEELLKIQDDGVFRMKAQSILNSLEFK